MHQATRLFVYGTLMRGQCRARFLAEQYFVCVARTTTDYQLIDLGAYPGLIEASPDQGQSVHGELYEVTPACLQILDRVEGVDEQLFKRGHVQLIDHTDPAITYFYARPIRRPKLLGDRWPKPTD